MTEQFNKKRNSVCFDAERSLVELLLTKSDNVIKKIETEFDQELKKQHPYCTDVKKLEIMQKHQGYKKKLAMRRKRKWVKFMERERKLELREEMELHNKIEKSGNDNIYTPVQSETMTKKEESKDKLNLTDMENYDENHKGLPITVNKGKRKRPMLKNCRVGAKKKELL